MAITKEGFLSIECERKHDSKGKKNPTTGFFGSKTKRELWVGKLLSVKLTIGQTVEFLPSPLNALVSFRKVVFTWPSTVLNVFQVFRIFKWLCPF